MKTTLALLGGFAALVGAVVYDGLAPEHSCRIEYDTSFNGLWLLKQKQCTGALGIPHNPRTIDRRPLFREF